MGTRFLTPQSLEEALRLGQEHAEGGRYLAGGTDLVVLGRKSGAALPPVLVFLGGLPELAGISAHPDGSVRIGAATRHRQIEADARIRQSHSALTDAVALIGSPATRNLGTLGGNLANASPANETGSPLLVLDATVELSLGGSRRVLPLSELFVGPGRTLLKAGEMLVGITLPPPPPRSASAYVRLEYRQAMEIAVVGAAARVTLDSEGGIAEVRVALSAVAPTCVEVGGVTEALAGRRPDAEAFQVAGDLAQRAAKPIDDIRAPAAYRAAMVPVVVRRALELAASRIKG